MKNYFKTYYKTRINNRLLGEQVDHSNSAAIQNALTKHNNIMEGYNPGGRQSGIMNPENRANYITHFTNFLKEQFKNDNINWKESKSIHQYFVEQNNSSYISAFADFMNTPSTNIILETVSLNESHESDRHPFINDIIDAVRKHVKNPHTTISSSHGDNFDYLDHANEAAKSIIYHMQNKDSASPIDNDRHNRRIEWLKSIIPSQVVDELISKHFN